MDENNALVSVVIPVYNGAAFLAEAIECVTAQGYQPLELLVIDDGSTDSTADVAARYSSEVVYAHQSNAGPAAARNRGIDLAKGEMLAFLDVDDLWSEDKLRLQTAYLKANPNVDIVQGHIQRVQLAEKRSGGRRPSEAASAPYRYVNIGSALFRRSVFDTVGLFDETLRDSEDVDWFIRAWENNVSKVVLESVTLFYRRHDRNITDRQNPINYGLTKLVKRHLDRRRSPALGSKMAPGLPGVVNYLGNPPEDS